MKEYFITHFGGTKERKKTHSLYCTCIYYLFVLFLFEVSMYYLVSESCG